MTYNVFGGTLNLAQSQSQNSAVREKVVFFKPFLTSAPNSCA